METHSRFNVCLNLSPFSSSNLDRRPYGVKTAYHFFVVFLEKENSLETFIVIFENALLKRFP